MKTVQLNIRDVEQNEIPLIGWHNPWGEAEFEGRKYKVSVVGGCLSLWVEDVETRKRVSVSLVDVAELLVKELIARGPHENHL
jgi:hypothetical protein